MIFRDSGIHAHLDQNVKIQMHSPIGADQDDHLRASTHAARRARAAQSFAAAYRRAIAIAAPGPARSNRASKSRAFARIAVIPNADTISLIFEWLFSDFQTHFAAGPSNLGPRCRGGVGKNCEINDDKLQT